MANPSTNKKRAVLRARRKKINKIVKAGMIYIRSTFNNVNITVSDNEGKVVAWASAGSVGFKGTKKSTPFAATQTAKTVIEKIKEMGFEEGQIIVNGVGNGKKDGKSFCGQWN